MPSRSCGEDGDGCVAVACWRCGCCRRARTEDDARSSRFWAMGYEGEVVAQLLPEFERAQSRHPGRPAAAAVDGGAREAADRVRRRALPDVSPLGNTWIPEFAALDALEPLDARIARDAGLRRAPIIFPGVWDSGVIDGKTLRGPVVRRNAPAVLSHATCSPQAGVDDACRATGRNGARRCARSSAHVGPDRYAILLPLNEFEPLLNLAVQQPDPLLRDGGRYGNFRSAGFKRTLAFYKDMFDQGWRRASTNTRSPMSGTSSASGYYSLLHLRALEHRRVPQAPAAGAAGRLDDDAAAGPERPGRIGRRRHQLRGVPAVAAQGRGVEADRVPVASPRQQVRFHALDRRPAAAALALADARAWRTIRMPRRSATSSSAPCRAEGAGVGAHRAGDAPGRRATWPTIA